MQTTRLATELFNYLYLREAPRQVDAIIGFGHFDPKISRHCAELYLQGHAPRILFTGGIGAGSTGLVRPESEEFLRLVKEGYPQIPESNILLETRSTNTGENLRYLSESLAQKHAPWQFGTGIRSVLLVANAYRQRRVWLTARLVLPGVELVNCPPETSFTAELELFRSRGEDIHRHVLGELERVLTYPEKGLTAPDHIPDTVQAAWQELRLRLNNG